MTDKVQKIREKVEKLHGNPYYMMAVKDVLKILDMQEELVSDKLGGINNALNQDRAIWNKEEPISEDLQSEIDCLSKRYPEVSFAKLSRIAVHIANWQKQQIVKENI
jgi:hypothetical protein